MSPSPEDIVARIEALPEDLRKKAMDFVDALLKRRTAGEPKHKHIPFGKFKGKVRMAKDFDAPLDDHGSHME